MVNRPLQDMYSDNGGSDTAEEESEEPGHCPRDCFPLHVIEELWHCHENDLHLVIQGQAEGNEESDVATIVQLFNKEDFFHQVEESCFWEEKPPGTYVGTLVTDNGSKMFCAHRLAEMVYLLDNLDGLDWTI